MQPPKKIFVSYSRKNRDVAEKLVKAMREAGLEVWFDKQIESGQDWDEVLEQRIIEADNLVVILSKTSVQSDYVKNEIFFAKNNNTTVNLIRIEECNLPLAIARMHYIEAIKDFDGGVASLISDITGDKRAIEKNTRIKKSNRKIRTIVISVVVPLVVIAAAILTWQFWPDVDIGGGLEALDDLCTGFTYPLNGRYLNNHLPTFRRFRCYRGWWHIRRRRTCWFRRRCRQTPNRNNQLLPHK